MKYRFASFQPQPTHTLRYLFLNLLNDKKHILSDLDAHLCTLQQILAGNETLPLHEVPRAISRATDAMIKERIAELTGEPLIYQTTQLAERHTTKEILLATEGLAMQLASAGVHWIEPGVIDVEDCLRLYYDENGRIIKTTPDVNLQGQYALEMIAGLCAQDFGLMIEHEYTLIYLYASARFEKTPKHIETGFDYFIGEDFFEWHRRIPGWGHKLAPFFELMYQAFKEGKLDCVRADLKGRNQYSDGQLVVQRYERDYALPLRTVAGETIGLTVFADSVFKDVRDEKNSFSDGQFLIIDSPQTFNQYFKVIKHATFQDHPYGMRDKDGRTKQKETIR